MEIIVKKSSSNRFHPHYNNAMGKYYHTASDYVSDLKKNGMEPYRPQDVKPRLSTPGYKPSEWAKKMTAVGVRQIQENGKTSGAFNAEMAKHLKTQVPDRIVKSTKGGIYAE